MIGRLAGHVVDVRDEVLILDVQGVGYAVSVPLPTATAVVEGSALTLWIYTSVREDAIVLFGFAGRDERTVFEQLISVSQVGPRIGLNALSTLTPDALARAIEANDLRVLSGISGVGKKTAERIVLELRGKLAIKPAAMVQAPRPPADDSFAVALAQLGYKRSEIDTVAQKLSAEGKGDAPLAERITAALRHFSGARA